jgi:hypothetical protein
MARPLAIGASGLTLPRLYVDYLSSSMLLKFHDTQAGMVGGWPECTARWCRAASPAKRYATTCGQSGIQTARFNGEECSCPIPVSHEFLRLRHCVRNRTECRSVGLLVRAAKTRSSKTRERQMCREQSNDNSVKAEIAKLFATPPPSIEELFENPEVRTRVGGRISLAMSHSRRRKPRRS